MDTRKEARAAIKAAEAQIRRLATNAMESGLYDEVQQLANWAKSLAEICASDQVADEPVRIRRKRLLPKSDNSAYPRFSKADDHILKIGWSKRTKKEYQQKAPREVLFDLLERLNRSEATRRPVTTESLFPLVDREGGEVPSYQAYLVLRFLRDRGVVVSHGRKGYTIEFGGEAPSELAKSLWAQIPT